MNILVTTDKNYLPHAYTMLVSLLENNRHTHVNLYYIHYDIDDASVNRFNAFFVGKNVTCSFLRAKKDELRGLRTIAHITLATYLRIHCTDLLPPSVEKVLYLDPDIIVTGPLDELYGADMGDDYIAAVEDYALATYGNTVLNTPSESRYFNSGVMLIDAEKFRTNGIPLKVSGFLRKMGSKIEFCDQDALNGVLYDKWTSLHPRWNMQSSMIGTGQKEPSRLPQEVSEAVSDPVIIHYTGTGKPWQPFCDHPLRGLYWQYLKKTPFRRSELARYAYRFLMWKPKSITGALIRGVVSCLPVRIRRMMPRGPMRRLRINAPGEP